VPGAGVMQLGVCGIQKDAAERDAADPQGDWHISATVRGSGDRHGSGFGHFSGLVLRQQGVQILFEQCVGYRPGRQRNRLAAIDDKNAGRAVHVA
jgi:hypothetical protein